MRFQTMERSVMDRSFKILETPFGKVHIKKIIIMAYWKSLLNTKIVNELLNNIILQSRKSIASSKH